MVRRKRCGADYLQGSVNEQCPYPKPGTDIILYNSGNCFRRCSNDHHCHWDAQRAVAISRQVPRFPAKQADVGIGPYAGLFDTLPDLVRTLNIAGRSHGSADPAMTSVRVVRRKRPKPASALCISFTKVITLSHPSSVSPLGKALFRWYPL